MNQRRKSGRLASGTYNGVSCSHIYLVYVVGRDCSKILRKQWHRSRDLKDVFITCMEEEKIQSGE